LRRSFGFVASEDGRFLWDGGRQGALNVLITDVMQKVAETPADYAPVERPQVKYEYTIPSAGGGNPVCLGFNGKTYDFDVFGQEPDSSEELLSLYQRAYDALRKGEAKAFAECHTESSAKKFLGWIGQMGAEKFLEYRKEMEDSGRHVVFILDAWPMYIVFYQGSEAGDLKYEYLVRDTRTGQLKLTNFTFEGYLDDLLKDPELFIEPFLKPLLAGKISPVGTADSQVQPQPAKASAIVPQEGGPEVERGRRTSIIMILVLACAAVVVVGFVLATRRRKRQAA